MCIGVDQTHSQNENLKQLTQEVDTWMKNGENDHIKCFKWVPKPIENISGSKNDKFVIVHTA